MKLFSTLASLFILFAIITTASAQTIPTTDLNGYAWSSNVGWISLNCATGGVGGANICGTSNYKVTINSDRTITGYAWSSNVGWIRFGGLSGFPTGGGTATENANVTGTYPNIVFNGWARACAGTASAANTCATMGNSTVSGNWDGWIALRGTNHTVSANLTTGMNTPSYAWGSTVVGWVDMHSRVNFNPVSATLTGSGCAITTAGQNSCNGTLGWSISTGTPSPNIHNATANTPVSTLLSRAEASQTLTLGNNVFQARSSTSVLASRTLTATCGTGLMVQGSTCVVDPALVPAPTITIRVEPPLVRTGEIAVVNWTISDLTGSTCTLSGPGVQGAVTSITGSRTTSALNGLTTISMTCTGGYGSVTESVRIDVVPVAQEV